MRSVIEFESLILHIDAIEELSEILILDNGGLLNPGTTLRNFLEVDALHSDVVLFLLLLDDLDSLRSIDALAHFETQEVLDFDGITIINDIDNNGEMGTGQHHPEFVTTVDTRDHIADDALDGTQQGVSLLFLQPNSELETILAFLSGLFDQFEGNVGKGLGYLAQGTLHCYSAGFHFDIGASWDLELLLGEDVLH
jgi:hypothetical protein